MYGSVPLVMSQDTHLSVRIDKVPPGWTGKKRVFRVYGWLKY
jgi:hypothetical protein